MLGWRLGCRASAAATVLLTLAAGTAAAQTMIVGIDEKPAWDKDGKPFLNPPGKDTLAVVDMSKPSALRMVATIPLINTIVGPPTNLAVTPSRDVALVANSVKPSSDGPDYKLISDDKLFVVDLTANPPVVVSTVTTGKRPSGMAISPNGKLGLLCNRDDGTVSVLSINGKDVKVTDTVTVGTAQDAPASVAITPDGKRALVTKPGANKVAILAIDGDKVTYDKRDLPAGIFPYNVVISPNGKLALTADTGNGGSSDGNADTVSVIDLEANPIRVINHIAVGDSPEGLAFSPKGNLAVTVEARGSNQPKTSWFYHPGGAVTVLKIDGKKVTNAGDITVGALPEGAVFSADGSYLYVGNFIDKDLSILKVNGTHLTDVGRAQLPGQPASMRGGPQ
ncbi:MAG TPA: beta-propeller fold lactonase family protein [Stellaceae bacterium]|jgi:DNA-binding beta-propeller fold protein YncE|nr:beta-propeller fold lactonase family protein [Stellaceae bacterium]